MLNTLFGWYVQEKLNGRYISLVFKESLDADDEDTLTLDDVLNSAKIKSWLVGDNFILTDIWAYAVPGNVALTVIPDSDTTKQFYVEAVNEPTRTPISPPKLIETNLAIDYTNENQPNDLYIIIGAMKLSEANTAKFTLLSELIPESIENIDLQTLSIQKLLMDNQYQNNAIMQQNNILIIQMNALIKASGGEPLKLPDVVVMPPTINFPPDVVNPPGTVNYQGMPTVPAEVGMVCERRPSVKGKGVTPVLPERKRRIL